MQVGCQVEAYGEDAEDCTGCFASSRPEPSGPVWACEWPYRRAPYWAC